MPRKDQLLQQLLHRLDISCIDLGLAWQALTHSSYANEANVPHNERLEFLGDAVLELVCSQHLYENYPQLPEGELTRMRANLVCEATLAEIATDLQLGEVLLLGKSQLATDGRRRPSLLADAVESLLGAIYLSGGLEEAQAVYMRLFHRHLLALKRGELFQDHKTMLQELVQKERPQDSLQYEVVAEDGPDHAKTFFVALKCGGRLLGRGQGRSKKEAEQMAAEQALRMFDSK